MTAPRSEQAANQSLSALQRTFMSATGLGSGADIDDYELVETVQSERLTRDLIASENLLPVLFPKRWDSQTNSWRADSSFSGSLRRFIKGLTGNAEDPNAPPSMALAFETFDRLRTVELSQRTGLISIEIEWSDPEIAADWVNKTIQHANDFLMRRAEREALSRLEFYTNQVAQESAVNIRTNIYQLMQNEYERLATLGAAEEYALTTIDPAFVPNRRFRPQRAVIAVMGLVLGFLASIGYVVVKDEFSLPLRDKV